MPSGQRVDWRKTIESLKQELLSAAAGNASIFHAIVSSGYQLDVAGWKRLLNGSQPLMWGRQTWFLEEETIQFCYFSPARLTSPDPWKPENQLPPYDVLDAAQRTIAQFEDLGRHCEAAIRCVPADVVLLRQNFVEGWLPTVYRLCWNYPNDSVQAERTRVFKSPRDRLLNDPTYLELDYRLHVSLAHPDAAKDKLSVGLSHEGRTWTEEFTVPFPHAYFASLNPDIFTASALALDLMCGLDLTVGLKDGLVPANHEQPGRVDKAWKPKDLAKAEKIVRIINEKRKEVNSIETAAQELADENPDFGMTPAAITRMYYRYKRYKKNQKRN